jgi:hypothetical protein
MTYYRRCVLVQALIVVSGWASLRYGWGLEMADWRVCAIWGASMALLYPVAGAWVARGRGEQ